MISFFRKFRLRLLAQNRFSRYLIYALGEILLVVIGILIALQANNWNENRKTMMAIEETKKSLIEELKGHTVNLESAIATGNELAVVLDDLRKGEYNHEMKMNFGSFYGDFNLFDTFTFDLRRDNLDEFIAFEKALPEEEKKLVWIAKKLKHLMLERKGWESLATELSTARFKEFADELPWFYDSDSLAIQKMKNFFENDPFFRNKAIHYLNFQLNENVAYTTQVRAWTLLLLWHLDEERGDSARALSDFMEEFGYSSFETLSCSDMPYQPSEFIGYRKTFLVYNPTDERKSFSVVNHKGETRTTYNPGAKGLFPVMIYPKEFIQVGTSCEAIYSPVDKGYVIME